MQPWTLNKLKILRILNGAFFAVHGIFIFPSLLNKNEVFAPTIVFPTLAGTLVFSSIFHIVWPLRPVFVNTFGNLLFGSLGIATYAAYEHSQELEKIPVAAVVMLIGGVHIYGLGAAFFACTDFMILKKMRVAKAREERGTYPRL